MAIPYYGQNKDGDALNEAAKDLKQVYRFGTPPIVLDYEQFVNILGIMKELKDV